MRRTLVVGATSAIAHETAKLLASQGDRMFLLGRNKKRLEAVRDDLALRGASSVDITVLDVLDFRQHEPVIELAHQVLGGIDLVILAHGELPDQSECMSSVGEALRTFEVNALSFVSLLILLSGHLKSAGKGTIVVLSSVAGERGRRSNFVYGSAKGTISLFSQGLRSHLHGTGVRLITVKPGLVKTPMTEGMPKGLLWVEPQRVARGILRSLRGTGDVVYIPWYWRWIMLAVRLIPERLFKRLAF